MPNLDAVCLAAKNGDLKSLAVLLDPNAQPKTEIDCEKFHEALINSKTPLEVIELLVKVRGEPSLEELENWVYIANRDGCVAALLITCTKIIANDKTVNKAKRIIELGNLCARHDAQLANIWVLNNMNSHKLWPKRG